MFDRVSIVCEWRRTRTDDGGRRSCRSSDGTSLTLRHRLGTLDIVVAVPDSLYEELVAEFGDTAPAVAERALRAEITRHRITVAINPRLRRAAHPSRRSSQPSFPPAVSPDSTRELSRLRVATGSAGGAVSVSADAARAAATPYEGENLDGGWSVVRIEARREHGNEALYGGCRWAAQLNAHAGAPFLREVSGDGADSRPRDPSRGHRRFRG